MVKILLKYHVQRKRYLILKFKNVVKFYVHTRPIFGPVLKISSEVHMIFPVAGQYGMNCNARTHDVPYTLGFVQF